jgi:hypothetical protein
LQRSCCDELSRGALTAPAAIQERARKRGAYHGRDWTLDAEEVANFEGADLAVAALRLDYREPPNVRSRSYLTLVFERRDGTWLMVQDQNTPIK